jgi:hypothetical protein
VVLLTNQGAPKETIPGGDIEAAIVEIISSAAEIVALNVTSVATDMKGFNRGDRWIIISRQGGSYPWPKPEHARIDFECIAESRAAANDMIRACQTIMFREQNNYVGKGVRYISCSVESGIFQSFEKNTDQTRYVLALRVVHKPDPSSMPAPG